MNPTRHIAIAGGALTLFTLAAAPASAQTSIDRSFDSSPKDCQDIRWSQRVRKNFPNIATTCQSIQTRNGKAYAMLEGEVDEVINGGEKLRIDFKGGNPMTLAPPRNTTFYINGKETPASGLKRGDDLNIYIPEDRFQAEVAAANMSLPFLVIPIEVQPISASSSMSSSSSPSSGRSGSMASAAGGSDPSVTLMLLPSTQHQSTLAATKSGCWTTLYTKKDFNGNALTLLGPLDLKDMVGPFGLDWEEKLASIRTGPNTTVTLYDNEGYQDRSAKLQPGSSVANIDSKLGLFEQVKSMSVKCKQM